MPARRERTDGRADPGKKPPKTTVSARVDTALVEKLRQMAEWDRRDRSDLIEFAIEEYIAAHYDEFKARGQPRK